MPAKPDPDARASDVWLEPSEGRLYVMLRCGKCAPGIEARRQGTRAVARQQHVEERTVRCCKCGHQEPLAGGVVRRIRWDLENAPA